MSQLPLAEIRRLQTVQHISETFFQQLVRQRLLLIDWRLSRTKQPLWCTHCDVPSHRSATSTTDKNAAFRALSIFLNQTCWFLPHGNAGCAEGTADRVIQGVVSPDSAGRLLYRPSHGSQWHQPNCHNSKCVDCRARNPASALQRCGRPCLRVVRHKQ